jgi:hypothetical protein
MKPYDKCPGCKKWCDICYIAMMPKPGKQLTLFNNIQNNKKDDGNHAANILKDSGDKATIKTDKGLLPNL